MEKKSLKKKMGNNSYNLDSSKKFKYKKTNQSEQIVINLGEREKVIICKVGTSEIQKTKQNKKQSIHIIKHLKRYNKTIQVNAITCAAARGENCLLISKKYKNKPNKNKNKKTTIKLTNCNTNKEKDKILINQKLL